MFHIGQCDVFLFGRVLLQADVVIIWILDFGDVNLEIIPGRGLVPGVHSERVVHSLDVGNFHGGFTKAIAVLRFALNGAGRPLFTFITAIGGCDQGFQSQAATRRLHIARPTSNPAVIRHEVPVGPEAQQGQ